MVRHGIRRRCCASCCSRRRAASSTRGSRPVDAPATTAAAFCSSVATKRPTELLDLVGDQPELGYRIVGFVGPRERAVRGLRRRVGGRLLRARGRGRSAGGERRDRRVQRAARRRLCAPRSTGSSTRASTCRCPPGSPASTAAASAASSVGYEPVIYLERQTSRALAAPREAHRSTSSSPRSSWCWRCRCSCSRRWRSRSMTGARSSSARSASGAADVTSGC